MSDTREALRAAAHQYAETRIAHADARKLIEDTIAVAIDEGIPRMEIYDLVSEALTERRVRQIAEKRGLEPGRPWGHKPRPQTGTENE